MATAAPRGRPFTQGNTTGAVGRPKGARNRSSILLESLLQKDGETIVNAVLAAAAGGEMAAATMVLDRLLPVPKDRPLHIDLPETNTAEGVENAQAEIVAACASGRLLPSEAGALSLLVEARRRSIETTEFEQRLIELEKRSNL